MQNFIVKRCKMAEKMPGTKTIFTCRNPRKCMHKVEFKDVMLCKDEPIKREAKQ